MFTKKGKTTIKNTFIGALALSVATVILLPIFMSDISSFWRICFMGYLFGLLAWVCWTGVIEWARKDEEDDDV